MTVTIEVPDDLAARLQTLPQAAADLNAFAVAALAEKADAAQMDNDDYFVAENAELDPDLVTALREGLADRGAGRLHTLENVRAGVEAALAARRPLTPGEAKQIRAQKLAGGRNGGRAGRTRKRESVYPGGDPRPGRRRRGGGRRAIAPARPGPAKRCARFRRPAHV